MLLVWIVLSLPVVLNAAPAVQFPFGTVRGVDRRAQGTGRVYYTYHGIPYAEPPVGRRRFQPPEPYRGADPGRVINSNDFPAICMQPESEEFGATSEDCLFISVYAPPTNATKKVMVYIHGGGFTEGGMRGYVPGRMVTDHEVIVALIQYRLGALGWLSSGDDVLPGNLGLRDQLLGLKWIKDNIARFGGDPNDITIFGLSAGGISVSSLSLSPLAKGLFTKVIIQSGSVAAPWAINKNPRALMYQYAEAIGCKPRFYFPGVTRMYHQNILNCLMRKKASDLVFEIGSGDGDVLGRGLFSSSGLNPVLDGDVLPMDPVSIIKDETYLRDNGVFDRSYVIGVTNNEGLLLANIIAAVPFLTFDQLTLPSNVIGQVRGSAKAQFPLGVSEEMLNVVDFMYTFPRNADGSIPFQKVIDLPSDIGFVAPSIALARAIADNAPVYFYLFDHYPQALLSLVPVRYQHLLRRVPKSLRGLDGNCQK
ncbi:carboxylic ester hydrolase [Plakobranchus ocellatus]|uniref:Carboxylic ester hydrolase n=1 Tax=Plakobranchus ocellatus TaxID=259542 RepID=A0AAV4DE57_9GAST|nr:carboxylic ester hydrolase [Plakobranchus ocellatus]